ncbi:hypothetical protein BX616_006398, partial [Lobosporangium transversale]
MTNNNEKILSNFTCMDLEQSTSQTKPTKSSTRTGSTRAAPRRKRVILTDETTPEPSPVAQTARVSAKSFKRPR